MVELHNEQLSVSKWDYLLKHWSTAFGLIASLWMSNIYFSVMCLTLPVCVCLWKCACSCLITCVSCSGTCQNRTPQLLLMGLIGHSGKYYHRDNSQSCQLSHSFCKLVKSLTTSATFSLISSWSWASVKAVIFGNAAFNISFVFESLMKRPGLWWRAEIITT